jgi:regulatory protein
MGWSLYQELRCWKVKNHIRDGEQVVEVRRRAGKLRELRTSRGRKFIVLRDLQTEQLLEVGTELDGKKLEEIEGPLARTAGLALAYRLLSVRDRTEWEIRKSLADEGIARPEVVGDIVETLQRQGYVDDRRFASDFVGYMTAHRPSGPYLLKRKLRKVGVSEDIIEAEVGAVLTPEREREIALLLARKKLKGQAPNERAVRRIHGILTRRGFCSSVVDDICRRVLIGEIVGEGNERQD